MRKSSFTENIDANIDTKIIKLMFVVRAAHSWSKGARGLCRCEKDLIIAYFKRQINVRHSDGCTDSASTRRKYLSPTKCRRILPLQDGSSSIYFVSKHARIISLLNLRSFFQIRRNNKLIRERERRVIEKHMDELHYSTRPPCRRPCEKGGYLSL